MHRTDCKWRIGDCFWEKSTLGNYFFVVFTFNYPIWELTQQQVAVDASAVSQAGNFIIGALQLPVGNQLGVSDLRRDAMRTGHSDYAYKTALGEFIGRPHPKVVRG